MPLSGPEAALVSRQLAELHRVAQERLGLSAQAAVFAAWQQVSPLQPDPEAWYQTVSAVVASLRGVSEVLAARYFTLARAIGSGYGLPDPINDRAGDIVELGVLYQEFAESLNDVIVATSLDAPGSQTYIADDGSEDSLEDRLDALDDVLQDMFEQIAPDTESDEWREAIPVDTDWDWTDFGLDEDEERESLEELFLDLEEKVILQLEKDSAKELANDRDTKDSLKRIDEIARNKGALGAGYVDQNVMQPGRELLRKAGDADKRRYAWMRVTGPKPCAFCAMLASRGAVYDTKESAGFRNTYHPNCHCDAVPVWTDEPHYSVQDQFFIDSWSEATKGFSGKAALRAWRTWLTKQYNAGAVPAPDLFGPNRFPAS